MNDEELEKLVKGSIEKEEKDWADTVKDPLLQTITKTLSYKPIPLEELKPQINNNKRKKANNKVIVKRRKSYAWMYLLSLALVTIGIFLLWIKYF